MTQIILTMFLSLQATDQFSTTVHWFQIETKRTAMEIMLVTCVTTAQPHPTLTRSVNLKSPKDFKELTKAWGNVDLPGAVFPWENSISCIVIPRRILRMINENPQMAFLVNFDNSLSLYTAVNKGVQFSIQWSFFSTSRNKSDREHLTIEREESGNKIGITSPVPCNVALLLVYLFISLLVCLFVFVRVTRMMMAGEMRATRIEISE